MRYNIWDGEASGKVLFRASSEALQASLITAAGPDNSAVAMQVARCLFSELRTDVSAWNMQCCHH